MLYRLGEAPAIRTIHNRQRLGAVNQTGMTAGTSRPTPSPWHIYKTHLMKLNLQTVRFAADAMRIMNRATLMNGTLAFRQHYD